MTRFVQIDGCPVPKVIEGEVRHIKKVTGERLNSCYRGSDPGGMRILKAFGKMTQAQLYNGWLRRLPGYNPANPPGFSTHELYNDGVAFRGPRGMPISAYKVGQDWSNGAKVAQAYRNAGVLATLTYPNNPRERHHINIRKARKWRQMFTPLRRGSKGARVKMLSKRLMLIPDQKGVKYLNEPSSTFTTRIEEAVKKFQKDHGMRADGIVGQHTQTQIMASVRYHVHKKKARA